MDYFPSNWEIIVCQETATPCWVLGQGGAGEWLRSLICRWSEETEGAGSDRLQEGWAEREQPERMSQTEEKLIEPALIEKSTDFPPAVQAQLWQHILKDWWRIGVWRGEFRCQRECEMNKCVCVCLTGLTASVWTSSATESSFNLTNYISFIFEKGG